MNKKKTKKYDGVLFLQTKLLKDLNPSVNPFVIFNS
jgi:hypothetical protein